MLLQLSRLSFWLAAMLAAVALFAPNGRERPLTLAAVTASLLALAFWRSGLRRQPLAPPAPELPASRELDAAALHDAHQHVGRAAQQAASFESALHAVTRVLRSELGARASEVQRVLAVDHRQARLSGLIEAQPGYRMAPRGVALDGSVLGVALATGRIAGEPPGPIVVPVVAGDAVVATIELSGLALPIDPPALQRLLELAGTELGARAAPAVASGIGANDAPDIGDNVAEADAAASHRQLGGCHAAPASGILDDSAPSHGPDDPLAPSRRAASAPAMLNRPAPRPHAPAGMDAGGGAPPSALDAEALARLRELDPQGRNQLIQRVLSAFRSSVARLQPQLDAARASGDLQTLRLVAHTLKSSSGSIGALRLSQLCAQTEAAIRQGGGEDLNPGLDALNDAIAEALRAVDAQLGAGA